MSTDNIPLNKCASARLVSIIKRVTARLEYIEGRDGPNADVSVALSDLVAIRDAAIANTRAPDPVREELVAIIRSLEWSAMAGPDSVCPRCGSADDQGHLDTCRIKLALERTTP